MIPQKIATGCRTRYFRHAKELPYALKQFVCEPDSLFRRY
jgi:hypothetical protein